MPRTSQDSDIIAKYTGHGLPPRQTLFLKIKTSDPRIPTSSYFEAMKQCIASYSVSGENLDVILKFKGVSENIIKEIIEANKIPDDYLGKPIPIHAKVIKEDPIRYSSIQKDIGFIFIKCKPENLKDLSGAIRDRAYQVFETDDKYNLWAIFAENKIRFYDEVFQDLYSQFGEIIEHSFVSFVLMERVNKEVPPADLLREIRSMIRTAKGKKGYWSISIDMILAFLEGETSIPKIKKRIPQYSRQYLYKSKDRLLEKGFIKESRKEGRVSYYTVNQNRYPILYWHLFEK